MVRLTLDASLVKKLLEAGSAVALCDETGEIVGRFFPGTNGIPDSCEPPHLSEEELQRREQSDKWYSTAEVLDHLKKLGND